MDIIQILAIRYQFGHFFVELLERLTARLADRPDLQKVVLENLAEECGNSTTYVGPAHSEGRRRLLEALGINYEQWKPEGNLTAPQKVHPAAARVIQRFVDLINNPDPVIGYAAIARSEDLVVGQYSHLVARLRAEFPKLTDFHLEHLLSHIEHDADHSGDMFSHLQEADFASAARGIYAARAAWQEFWNEVS